MTILDGKMVANKLKEKIKLSIEGLEVKPGLAVICIGDDPASKLYVKLKHKICEELGIYVEEYCFENNVAEDNVLSLIDELNSSEKIHGILLQSPVPYHLNILNLFNRIAPEKDIDGFNPINARKIGSRARCFCTLYATWSYAYFR